MCGIIAAISRHASVVPILMDGLRRMEYRGYDSAGIALVGAKGFVTCKREGKLASLQEAVRLDKPEGQVGIGHTRWATHGAATKENAHPHGNDRVMVVHNGIIENHVTLQQQLIKTMAAQFGSETDTEVIPWLFEHALQQHADSMHAWQHTLTQLQGAYAIAALLHDDQNTIWFARSGSPLLLGRNQDSLFVASDALALAGMAEEIAYLQEGDYGQLSEGGLIVRNDGEAVAVQWRKLPDSTVEATDKAGFSHFMEKEIHEQPLVLSRILQHYLVDGNITFPDAKFMHTQPLPDRIVMVACGTSYHAALTARYWFERYLQISVEVDVASEYRYRDPVIGKNTWLITLSQSGETADTLEALRLFKRHTPDNPTLTLCNVNHASLARESDGVIYLHAGAEIGVASTKAYTAQLTVLILVSLLLVERCNAMPETKRQEHLQVLHNTAADMIQLLDDSAMITKVTHFFSAVHSALFLGRGPCYPLALEGALKLKEISYLHAEGYAAGEMKHGPIALIDDALPVVVIAPKQYNLEKVLSNLAEVQARGARVILLTDMDPADYPSNADAVIQIPEGDYFTTPLLVSIPLQLLSYYVAREKGTDVDQPRNLAKSVTVE
ncbi:MAG: glutamine--fructose-6-phosphate transaminase (isomerizing) [Mariprofundaceae bacterium]